MKRHWLAILTLLLVASAWGATFALIKDVLRLIAPEPFIAWRFTIAGIVLCAIALARRELRRDALLPGVLLGAFVFTGYWMQTHGLMLISPSRSALLTGLYVVLVPFTDALLHHTRVRPQAWIASVLALVGTAALIGGFNGRPGLGDLLTIACAVAFALHVVYSSRFSQRHPAIGLAAVQVLAVGMAAIPASYFAKPAVLSTPVLLVVLFTAIVTTALAFVALMWGQARVSATEAAVILAFEPVAASVVSIAWYGEPVTAAFATGGALILAAIVTSQV